jgi:hypothetical protein
MGGGTGGDEGGDRGATETMTDLMDDADYSAVQQQQPQQAQLPQTFNSERESGPNSAVKVRSTLES